MPPKKKQPVKKNKPGHKANGRFDNGNKIGNRWQKGESGNPSGRQKQIYNVLKEKGYQKHDIKACFGELLFYQQDELQEIIDNPDKYPAIAIIVSKALINAMKHGNMKGIISVLEYTLGKPTTTNKVKGSLVLGLEAQYVEDDGDENEE